MRCASCGHENPDRAKFCLDCGARFALRCADCGAELPNSAKVCLECGRPVGDDSPKAPPAPAAYTPPHLAERILAEQAAMESRGARDGERKHITALFADIKGSVELMEDLDPEEARAIVDPALGIMMEAVHRYEGYVAQSRGDGILALFGAPISHEDHPQRAIHAALRMQDDIKRYAAKLRREKGISLEIRVGLNSGEVVVRSIRKDDLHTDYAPIGHATNLAARMESLAAPGSILVTDDTRRLTEGYFRFQSLGTAKVKGVSGAVEIHEVAGVGPLRTRLEVSARRGLVHFVGRQAEMDELRRALERAKAGRGQIVGVMGEPGVGKSRLFHEFKLVSQSGCLLLEAFAASHGKADPHLPLIDLLKSYFRITSEDDDRIRREKIAGKVLTLDRNLEDGLPYVSSLLGDSDSASSLRQMDPQIRRQRTFEAVSKLLLRETLNQPLLVVIEDLHWIDGETDAFLQMLGDGVGSARIMLLVNYRPEYRQPWGTRSSFNQLRLDPLESESAEEMLTAIVGDAAALGPLKGLILEKSEGTPFFIEEIVQSLLDHGVLERNGSVRLAKVIGDIDIPPTVDGVLAARIDRLAPEEKELLQTAAVIGREFSLGLVERVTGRGGPDLARSLAALQEREFLYEQPASSDIEYIFKHALTREVAYNSLLVEKRSRLHERAAQAIESLFADRVDEHYGELAHHYGRSGNTEKAVEYLVLAGRKAVERSADAEAITMFRRALELLADLPPSSDRDALEVDVRIALGSPLVALEGYGSKSAHQLYERARELCRKLHRPVDPPILRGLGLARLQGCRFDECSELGQALVHHESHDPIAKTEGQYLL
ncbi:MAG: adenylate/guanylate cyclase domain-containing protein, partial [Candidatus Binatia bacterium]